MTRPAMYCDAYVRRVLADAVLAAANPSDASAQRTLAGHAMSHGIDCSALLAEHAPVLREAA